MSFSQEVKQELLKINPDARHCKLAELAAILIYSRAIREESSCIEFRQESQSDEPFVMKKGATLLGDLFGTARHDNESNAYFYEPEEMSNILQTIKYDVNKGAQTVISPLLIKSSCCKRAFLRGAYLCIGSMSNPQKGYHLEFVCEDDAQAEQITEELQSFGIVAKKVIRKKYKIVYIKESEEIVELLNVIGAHRALMNLENLRILKDMKNSINRKVNCEAANITKTVNAASKQIEDIELIAQKYGLENLSPNLRMIAEVRLENPDATLKELGELLEPPVGKSGVNHRLRKLGEIADKIR